MDSLQAKAAPLPESRQTQLVSILRAYLLAALLVTIAGILTAISETYGRGSIWGFSGSTLVGLWPLYLYASGLLAGIHFSTTRYGDLMIGYTRASLKAISRLRIINWVLMIILIGFYGYLILADFPIMVFSRLLQIFVFGHICLLGAFFMIGTGRVKPVEALIGSFSLYGLFIWVVYWIPDVQTYPLSMGWSETTWFYDASLFFSKRLYGFRVPLSSLHPSRYLLQSAAYLLPVQRLWAHRFWQVFLWIGLSLAGGLALKKRIKPENRWFGLGIVAWFTLFTFQGPVYFHLMMVIVIVLLGFNKNRLGWTFIIMVLASFWAGLSRVNWFPVAGMLAATVYILEIPQEDQPFCQYWRWPVLTAVMGLFVGFFGQAVYVFISGRLPQDFISSFRSPLLFYRLFPNEAFGMGILLMILFVSLPTVVLILWQVLPKKQVWRPIRLAGLLTILVALLIAGLIVSSKIGGGNNLHNLDSFLVFLAVIALYILFDRFAPDDPDRLSHVKTPVLLILLTALFPIMFVLGSLRPYSTWDHVGAWKDIEQVQALIDQNAKETGEVLFIQDRHLLTFGLIDGVEMVPEYEKVFLMEMAMSENENYLEGFHRDIQSQRFDLIVIEPLFFEIKPQTEVFSEESNAWTLYVARPIDQYYQVVYESTESELSVLVPRIIK